MAHDLKLKHLLAIGIVARPPLSEIEPGPARSFQANVSTLYTLAFLLPIVARVSAFFERAECEALLAVTSSLESLTAGDPKNAEVRYEIGRRVLELQLLDKDDQDQRVSIGAIAC